MLTLKLASLPTHSLVCAVSYTSQFGEKLYFRKFFKFQVRYIWTFSLAGSGEIMCGLGGDSRNATDLQQWKCNYPYPSLLPPPALAVICPHFGNELQSCSLLCSVISLSLNNESDSVWLFFSLTILFCCCFVLFFSTQMEAQCDKASVFSFQSIFNQVLKPLDVKTKFYNAEVSDTHHLCYLPCFLPYFMH